MKLSRAIREQRAARRLSARPVPFGVVMACLEAALQAPSGSNAQRWEWILVGDLERKAAIARLNRRQAERYLAASVARPPRLYSGVSWMADHLSTVPWLVVPCYWRAGPAAAQPDVGLYASIFPAVQNFLLAATAAGLGTTLTTMALREEEALRDVLALPEDLVPCALIPVGYTDEPPIRKRRRALPEVVHLERFGERVGAWDRVMPIG